MRSKVIVFLILTSSAAAESIQIDPDTYGGTYCVDDRSNCRKGGDSFELEPGRHKIIFAPGNGFSFDVEQGGLVTVPSTFEHSADGGNNSLKFRTASVTVNFGKFTGSVRVNGATDIIEPVNSPVPIELVKGVPGWIFQLAPGTSFRFDTDEAGKPVVDPVHATVSGHDLTLRTKTLVIDPNGYPGDFGVAKNLPAKNKVRSLELIPGIDNYSLIFASGTSFRFNFGSDGTVTQVHGAGAEASANILRLLPIELLVTPLDPNVSWYVVGAERRPGAPGQRAVTLIPDITGWAISVGSGTAARFALDSAGEAVPPVVAVLDGNKIHEFELFKRMQEITCAFSAELDLRHALTPALPADPTAAELTLAANMTFEAMPFGTGDTFAWFRWAGEVEITDASGEMLTGRSGAFLLMDDGQQRGLGFYVVELTGSLGGEAPGDKENIAMWLTGPARPRDDLSFPDDLTEWDIQTSRVFVFRAFDSQALADVSALSFRGRGCY